jgi:Zn-dependent protease with chaperone function
LNALQADYFDGREARARPATLTLADGALVIAHADGERRIALADLRWPERQRHGPRIAHIAGSTGGGSLQCDDAAAWDGFVATLPAHGLHGVLAPAGGGWVTRAQQSWRATLAAVALLIAVVAAGYLWGVPWAGRAIAHALPLSLDRAVGELALDSIGETWLAPSKLAPERRERIAADFARMVALAFPDAATRPVYSLRFHASKIGPNAFALPGGAIVLTDELVELMAGRDEATLGVLAHELGHVGARHGMRLLVQVSLIGAATSVALGDFSSVLAGVPALVGQMAYSREAEREADAESVRMMRASGIAPAVMAEFFERAEAWRQSDEGRKRGLDLELPIAFSSHPADEERKAFFRAAR